MPRRLFLHCGPAKTGTSTLQACLRDTPPPGLIYPRTGQWPDGAHHKLSFALKGMRRRGEIDIPEWDALQPALVAELDAAPADALISSEMMDLDALRRLLDRLLPALGRPFDSVEILYVLRHPLERAASAYNQNVKDPVTAEVRLPDQFLNQSGATFRLTPRIRAWRQAPCPVRFLSYHPPATLVRRFLEHIGHDGPCTAPERRNASINGYGLIALLAAHRLGLAPAQRARLFDALRQDRRHRIWAGPSFPFSAPATRRYLRTVVRGDLAAARELTGIDLTGLHREPPERFELSERQCQAIRRQFGPLDLSPQQKRQLNRILARFQTQADPAAPSLDAGGAPR